MKKYYRITYQWPPGARGAVEATVAVEEGSKPEMIEAAVVKLSNHCGQEVRVLTINKMPSNYKALDENIIE